MKLFEMIPERFFQLFTGKNRQVYAEALLLLYEQHNSNRFGIEYDLMRDLFQELIETQQELGYAFDSEEDQIDTGASALVDNIFVPHPVAIAIRKITIITDSNFFLQFISSSPLQESEQYNASCGFPGMNIILSKVN